jgi:hypothetical protein
MQISIGTITSAIKCNRHLNQYLSRLDEVQEKEYFEIYCHLFWQQAKFEYLSQSHKLSRTINSNSSPVQEISVAHKHVFPESLPEYLSVTLPHATHIYTQGDGEKFWDLVGEDLAKVKENTNIWFNLNQISSTSLKHFVNKTKHIFLSEMPLLQMISAKDEAWLLPEQNNRESFNWALKLSSDQMDDCIQLNETIASTKNWQLTPSISLADVEKPIRYLHKVKNEVQWQDNIKVELGQLECLDFNEYEDILQQDDAIMFCDKPNLIGFDLKKTAKSILYSVEIDPPRLPKKSIEDKLHQQWKIVQEQWDTNLADFNEQLEKIESSKNNIADSIKHLMGGFLTGQLNSQRTLSKELVQLSEIKLYQLSPSCRIEQLGKMQKIANSILNRGKKLTNEQDKAEQQLQWKNKENQLNKAIQLAQERLNIEKSNLSSFKLKNNGVLEKELSSLLEKWIEFVANTSLIEEDKKARLIDFNEKDIYQWVEKGPGKKAFLNKTKSADQKLNQQLKDIATLSKNYKYKSTSLKTEEEKLNKAIQSAQSHLQRSKNDREKHGSFQAKENNTQQILAKLLGVNKIKNNKYIIDLPNEDLPMVGKLYVKENQRYLVIKTTNEIVQGKCDCTRLNAKLVVEKDY